MTVFDRPIKDLHDRIGTHIYSLKLTT